MTTQEPLMIRGGRDGLRLVVAHDAPWPHVLTSLQQRLSSSESFFAGARLTIDVGERPLADDELRELLGLMDQHGLRPEALATGSRESRSAARRAGITARPGTPRSAPAPEGEEALFVRRTVRSGQVLRSTSHIVVLGDVNAGSELIAGGSIIIWGRLRGTAHAGALGDPAAVVCALDLQPSRLQIAETMARPPDRSRPSGPEQARRESEQIIVVTWEAGRR